MFLCVCVVACALQSESKLVAEAEQLRTSVQRKSSEIAQGRAQVIQLEDDLRAAHDDRSYLTTMAQPDTRSTVATASSARRNRSNRLPVMSSAMNISDTISAHLAPSDGPFTPARNGSGARERNTRSPDFDPGRASAAQGQGSYTPGSSASHDTITGMLSMLEGLSM